MKIQIELFTGFLSSGKTSLINQLLKSRLYDGERIVIFQCEAGEEELLEEGTGEKNIFVKRLGKDERFSAEYIKAAVKKYMPHRIIIEQNGMSRLEELLLELENREVRKQCGINSIVHVVDCRSFDMLMNIVGSNLIEKLSESDLVVFNHAAGIKKERMEGLKRTVKVLNKSAQVAFIDTPEDFSKALEDGIIYTEDMPSFLSKPSDKLMGVFFVLILAYFLFNVFRMLNAENISLDFSGFQVFITIFASILMQALPFLLIGVLISSVIQIFVTRDMVAKYFPKNKIFSFGAAMIAGVFFPVCDCAIVPVASRLVKKGVPLPAAVTFLLAAPIVNPVVLVSTMYAFPQEPAIAFYRLYLGITIALAAGLTFQLFPEEEQVQLEGTVSVLCGCAYCTENGTDKGLIDRVTSVLKHAAEEIFDVGRFLIAGALLTSILQMAIPKEVLSELGSSPTLSLLVMMATAFVLSVCSSSDAFIARSFAGQFSMGSIMGFLVLGPMLDIKNILMLWGSFKKRFVIKLVFVVVGLSFAVLSVFSILLFGV